MRQREVTVSKDDVIELLYLVLGLCLQLLSVLSVLSLMPSSRQLFGREFHDCPSLVKQQQKNYKQIN